MGNIVNVEKTLLDIRKIKSIDTINFILEDLGLKSVSEFCKLLGHSRPEKIYKILRGENSISKNVAEEIHKAFPQYKMDDVLDGNVERLKNKDLSDENLSKIEKQEFELLPLNEKLNIIFAQNLELEKKLDEIRTDIQYYGLKKKLILKKDSIEKKSN